MREIALAFAVLLNACSVQDTETRDEANVSDSLSGHAINQTSTKSPEVSDVAMISGNIAHNQLASMALAERNTMLAKLMRASGETCPAVARSFHNGATEEGEAFWTLDCGTKDWLVMIEPDSSTQLLECSVSSVTGANSCWTKF